MDACLTYDAAGGAITNGHNVVSVTNGGVGLWDCVFSYTSRTATANRFMVQASLALGAVGFGSGTVTAIGADTVTVRVATYSVFLKVDAVANPGGEVKIANGLSFNVWFKEL